MRSPRKGWRWFKFGLRNKNCIRHTEMGDTAKQVQPESYLEPTV